MDETKHLDREQNFDCIEWVTKVIKRRTTEYFQEKIP